MKVLKYVGALFYSLLMYYLLWLFFYWVTPFVMGLSWKLLIVYLFIAGGLFTILTAQLSVFLCMPFALLVKGIKPPKYLPALFGLFFGYSSVKLPWIMDFEYGVLQWILALSLTGLVLKVFITFIAMPFKLNVDEP